MTKDCKYRHGEECDALDGESCHSYIDDYPLEECPYYSQIWDHPEYCPRCKFNYGSDLCCNCKPGVPSKFYQRSAQAVIEDQESEG